jgi:hypothetical protein
MRPIIDCKITLILTMFPWCGAPGVLDTGAAGDEGGSDDCAALRLKRLAGCVHRVDDFCRHPEFEIAASRKRAAQGSAKILPPG